MSGARVLVLALEFVSIECMPPLTIINKSLAATDPGVFVGGNNFCDAWERFRDCGNFLAQIDQQITVPGRCGVAADRDRCRRFGGRLSEYFMGNKTAVPEGPQQVIDLLHGLTVRDVNVDGIVETVGFFGESTGKSSSGLNTRAANNIKIDL